MGCCNTPPVLFFWYLTDFVAMGGGLVLLVSRSEESQVIDSTVIGGIIGQPRNALQGQHVLVPPIPDLRRVHSFFDRSWPKGTKQGRLGSQIVPRFGLPHFKKVFFPAPCVSFTVSLVGNKESKCQSHQQGAATVVSMNRLINGHTTISRRQ